MSLEQPTAFEKFIESAKNFRYWKVVSILAGALIVFGLVLFLVDRYRDWDFKSDMDKANANLANAVDTLSNIQEQKRQLDIDEARQIENVKQAARDADEKAKAVAEAKRREEELRHESNKAIANVDVIDRGDFNGSSTGEANRSRCRAFPNADGCR